MAYATLEQLESRLADALAPRQEVQATQLLEDASIMLDKACARIDTSAPQMQQLLELVCCNMVARVLAANAPAGATSFTASAGEFSQRIDYAAPTGKLYISKDERRMLGVSGAAIGSIRAEVHR